MKDATGRELVRGQLVDIPMTGMQKGIVLDVRERASIMVPGQPPAPPSVIIQIIMNLPATPMNTQPVVYITGELPEGMLDRINADVASKLIQ